MRIRPVVATVAVLCALLPAAAHRPAAVRAPRPHGTALVRGALHVHSGASHDARGGLDAIAAAARRADLDFVVVTDHNTDASLAIDGYRRGVLVLGGLEKSTDEGHALVLGIDRLPFLLDGDPATVMRDVAGWEGFVVAAHPASSRPDERWTWGWDGVSGMEVLNLAEPGGFPHGMALAAALARYAVDPQGALLASMRVSRDAVDAWDRVLATRPIAGLLGSDAHGGVRVGRVWIPMPAHERVFRIAAQYLLLGAPLCGDAARDGGAILAAVRAGRGWVGLDGLAPAHGFAFSARNQAGEATMGGALPLSGPTTLEATVDAPAGTTLVLLRNGRAIARGAAIHVSSDAPGTYRVEAYLPAALVPGGHVMPWILSNPIALYPVEELHARAARACRLPAESDASDATATEPIPVASDGAPSPDWQIDRSPDAGASVEGSGGDTLRFDYRLGASAHTHAALANWRAQDLSGWRFLQFRARADRPMRFDVQVRTAAGDGQRIWRVSERADVGERIVTVPLSALKTYDHAGGNPDLARTVGLYFHVDEAIVPRGASGTLWVGGVRLAR